MDTEFAAVRYKNNTAGRWYAYLLTILPVILVYKTPGLTVGLSTTLVALTLPLSIGILLKKGNRIRFSLLWPFLAYLIYALFKSTPQDALLCIAIGIHICAISKGVVDGSKLRRIYEKVSTFAAICVIIQQTTHLLLGFHIPLIWTGGLIDGIKSYAQNILTGIPLGDTMYRPCAFFLEPSHMSQYCIIGLGSVLYRTKPSIKRALLISFGMLLTTSGIGLVLTFTMWAWWWLFRDGRKNSRNTLFFTLSAIVIVLILSQTPIFQTTLSRIISNPEDDYNAINGRLFWWDSYFGDGQISSFIFGKGTANLPEDYFTGIMTQLFAYGIIGTGLFILFNVLLIIKSHALPRIIASFYLLLLVFSNLIGFIFMISIIGSILTLINDDKYMISNYSVNN